MKIISGGQSGADLGGIDFAVKYRIDYKINIFKGFRPLFDDFIEKQFSSDKINYIDNSTSTYLDYLDAFYKMSTSKCIEKLKERTMYNVINSDITLIIIDKPLECTRGSLLTYKLCVTDNKPRYVCRLDDKLQIELVRKFLRNYDIYNSTINIAGQRDSNRNDVVKYLEKMFCEHIEVHL